ncbi:hypothetical protein AAC387_Pa11g1724 [Persea americana]
MELGFDEMGVGDDVFPLLADAFEVGKGFGWEKEEDFEDDVEREAGNSVLLFHGTRFLGNRFSLSLSLS